MHHHSKCVLVALVALVTVAAARTTTSSQANSIPSDSARSSGDDGSVFGDLRFLHKVYQDCASADISTCLKTKLVTAMDRAARAYPDVQVLDGVTFVKDPAAEPIAAAISTETELEASLPRALGDREDALNSLIMERVFDFFQSHTLQVKLPTADELQRSLNGEERGKKKKMAGLLLIPLLLGGTLIPLALGALALLAGKALIVSKLALVLAAIIGLKKLLSGHHGGHGHEEVVVAAPVHGGSGWGRSYEKDQAQNLAYGAYAPKATR